MRVLILAAGQGKRLLPLTAEQPKALLDIGGKSLIARQISAFAALGIDDFVVIIGYGADRMEADLARLASALKVTIQTVYNPFYAVADNLASCWLAREHMVGDFIQVNGDNVFDVDLVSLLLKAPVAAVRVAVNYKSSYDSDDMKVRIDGTRLIDIGKTLAPEFAQAEAIGFYHFQANAVRDYQKVLEEAMRGPFGLKQWFPAAIGLLAQRLDIQTLSIGDIEWAEVDVAEDLRNARTLVARWERLS